jgi:hypothetical protein
MKGFQAKAIILLCGFFLSSSVLANKNMNHKWICETNASSASQDTDKKADDMMSKKAMSAKEAFNFAYKHCRDCTKITCSAINENGENNKDNH